MWYINPQNLCTDYIEKFEPYTNVINEIDVMHKIITVFISHDNRISSKVSYYYKYYIEYSTDNFNNYTSVSSHSHIKTVDHLEVSFINVHPPDVQIWVRARLFREDNGVKDTGADPVSVMIPGICSPLFNSDTCQTLTFSCSKDCDVGNYSNDEMSILYKLSEDITWVSIPVHPHTCPINLPLYDGGRYESKLRLISYQNGVLVNAESDMIINNVDKCTESTSGSLNQHTVIIVVVFLILFVIATTILLIVLCKREKCYLYVQNICKKKQSGNVQRDRPGEQYENVSYVAESNKVQMPQNVSSQENDTTYQYTNDALSLDPKDLKVDVIDSRIYANSEIDARRARHKDQEEHAYLGLSNNDSNQQTPSYYEHLSRR